MKTRYLSPAALALTALTACNNHPDVKGSWVEPVPGMADMLQGFTLEPGGKASSINTATLQYDTWEQKEELLILSGKSIGNRQTLPFSDTLTIEKLTPDSLILRKGDLTLRYSRSKEEGKESISASVVAPAIKTRPVKGTLVIGHEVRSFTAAGDTLAHWIVDETGTLLKKYDEVTEGTKNGIPVYAELEVSDTGKATDGFAAGYGSVYHVIKIISITR